MGWIGGLDGIYLDKLQFNIQNMLIVMFGTIKNSEFNPVKNESLLHFECTHIDQLMRNEVLSFVYNLLPQTEKEVMEALSLTDEDLASDVTAPKESSELDIPQAEEVPEEEHEPEFDEPQVSNI